MSDAVSYDGDVLMPEAPQYLADLYLGPMQVGYQVQFLGFGVFATLFTLYAATGELRRHQRVGQIVLVVSFILNFVYTSVIFYESYVTSVSQNRTTFNLENGDACWNSIPMLIAAITAVTEGFLTARAGVVSSFYGLRRLILSRPVRILFFIWMGCLIGLVIIGGAVTTADGVFYYEGSDGTDLAIPYNTGQSLYFWGSTVADISISIACAWSLRSRIAGFNARTDSLLRHLIVVAFRTAAYTAILSVVSAILSSMFKDDDPRSFITYAFWMLMPSAYALSLFTFSVSSKRAIDQRLGSSGAPGYVPAQPPKRPQLATSPATETSIPLANVRASTPLQNGQIPLQIRVKHEEVVAVDDDLDYRDSKSTMGRQGDWEV